MTRFFKISIAAGFGLLSSYAAYNINDLNSLGVVRFGRAAKTVIKTVLFIQFFKSKSDSI